MKLKTILLILMSLILIVEVNSQKVPIDENSHKEWRRVSDVEISNDGRYVKYKYTYIYDKLMDKEYDSKIYLYNTKRKKSILMDSITSFSFWADGKWLIYDEKNGDKSKKIIQRLKNGKKIIWDRKYNPITDMNAPIISYKSNKNRDLTIINIEKNDSITYKNINRSNIYDNGEKIIYIKDNDTSFDLCYGDILKPSEHITIYSDKNKKIKSYGFSSFKYKVDFEIPVDTAKVSKGSISYQYCMISNKKKELFNSSLIKLEDSSVVASLKSVKVLSNNNFAVFDVLSPVKNATEKRNKIRRDSSFELELWSWNDPVVQSVQAISYHVSRPEPIKYIYNKSENRSYQITGDNYTSIYFSNNITSEHAIIIDETPYEGFSDWENQNRADFYLLNLSTGEKQMFAKKLVNRPEWSQNGDYITFWDSNEKAWFSVEPRSMKKINLTKEIPYAVHDKKHDKPNPVPSYGLAAWTENGENMLIYDKNDIWIVDITGETKPVCYTKGYGRRNNKSLRFLNHNYSDLKLDLSKKQNLEVYSSNRDKGFYSITSSGKMIKNIEGPFALRVDKISKNGKAYICTKQTFTEDRDIWITDSKFKKMHRISDVSPQLKNYKLGSVEIVEWENYSGTKSKGLLYTPEDYVEGDSYPTIVNFYETHTGGLHSFHSPGVSNAMINVANYVSNGYIVFMPDVYFKIGEPAQSSYDIVVSGTKALIEKGVIDAKRVGLQGHSWSGYQTACLITMTDIFTCVNIGAPISNMTSGYVGLREGTGKPRMFMYEDWQCRMGATLWENLDGYIRNSPILYADKIKTPVLLFHCDQDEAVSFIEGRNLFLALRRLQVPSWLLNYKGEGHFVMGDEASEDWTKRMGQFFNHYLNNAPMPRWMNEGINVNERGYDQKYDFVKE